MIPPFLEQPHYFTNPSLFIGKLLAPLFLENLKNSIPSLFFINGVGGRGGTGGRGRSNYDRVLHTKVYKTFVLGIWKVNMFFASNKVYLTKFQKNCTRWKDVPHSKFYFSWFKISSFALFFFHLWIYMIFWKGYLKIFKDFFEISLKEGNLWIYHILLA